MTTQTAPTGTDVLTVVKHLAGGRSVEFVATVTHLDPAQVQEIGDTYGWPDLARLAISANELERGGHQAAIDAIPTRVADPPAVRPPAPRPPSPRQLLDIPIRKVIPDPDNPREDIGNVADLARSMRSVGMVQPIVARMVGDQVVVVAGHRRLAAAQQLGWSTVPVIIRRDLRPDHVLIAMYVENAHRTDLDPIEEARALTRIRAQHGDCPIVALAKIVGRSQTHVSARLALLALPIEEQEALRAGSMTLGEATKKARIEAGTARRDGFTGHYYLGVDHALATHARARCKRLHKKARLIGAVACGECWESVIRADERQHIHTHAARSGQCPICSGPYGSVEQP